MTDLINYEAVYRTAPATPGLLNTYVQPNFYRTYEILHRCGCGTCDISHICINYS